MNPADILNPIPSTDLAYRVISALLPIGENSPYGMAFSIVTSTLVFFGAIFLAWHVIVGVVASAYSGKVLGEKWHQIWAPLRVVAGFGLLLPVSDGYSTAHIILKDVVAVAAINVANTTISTFVTTLADGDSNAASSIPSGGNSVARIIMERELCLAISNASGHGRREIPAPGPSIGTISTTSGTFSYFGFLNIEETTRPGWDYGACGHMFFADPDAGNEAFQTARDQATGELVASIREASKPIGSLFGTTRTLSDLDDETVAEMIRDFVPSGEILGIPAAVQQWTATVGTAATARIAQADETASANMKEFIDNRGFMAAGTYWRAVSSRTAAVVNLVNETPVVSETNLPEEIADKTSAAMVILGRMSAPQRADWRDMQDFGRDQSSESTWDRFTRPISQFSSEMVAGDSDNWIGDVDSPDQVGRMINMGHGLLWLVTAYILSMAGLSALAVGATNSIAGQFGAGAAEGALAYLSGWLDFAMTAVMLAGLVNAYVLPMIPFIMVFMMGMGWVVLFLEASIAIILWAFSFIRMDGADFVDQHQKNGAALLFNLLLRPALGMLAFIGSFFILPVLLGILATLWTMGFVGAQGGHFTGLFGSLTSIILYSYMQWQICLRVFGMIPTITDRVTKWSGLGDGQGYNDGSETDNMSRAFIGAAAMSRGAPMKAALPERTRPTPRSDSSPQPETDKGRVKDESGK